MAGRPLAIAAVAGAALLLAASGSPRSTREGGTFRFGTNGDFFGSIDAPLAGPLAAPVLHATCGGLMTTPDQALPAGMQIVPEIAVGYPRITNGGKTYTFSIRKGIRFSNGAAVTAKSFAHTINRLLSPTLKSPSATEYVDILGARKVIDGKATTALGVVARGDTLIIRLNKPDGSLLGKLTAGAGGFCVVPETLSIDPEGARAPLPSAGPYYVSEYVPGERVVLERNRFYRGERPHHVDRFVGDLSYLSADPAPALDKAERGTLDWAFVVVGPRAQEFARKYGVNRTRFYVAPGTALRLFVLNTERPLFRKNVMLRQAINFAVDRRAIMREQGRFSGHLTDQFLPPGLPGFRDERIYPLNGPDVAKARALARGHLRSGKAVLYTGPDPVSVAHGQILKANLSAIGLDLEIKTFPGQSLFQRLGTRGEPFDIGRVRLISGRPDPTILNAVFDGRTIGQPDNGNWSYFNSPKYNRLLEAASRLPSGSERLAAYGKLDVDLARNAAPAIAISYDNVLTLVSKRTGCVVVNPYLDLAAVCLK